MQNKLLVFTLGGLVLFTCSFLLYLYMISTPLATTQPLLPRFQNIFVKTTDVDNTRSRIKPFRGLLEENRLEKLCRDVTKTVKSETKPPFYPYEGIGSHAIVSDDEFDTSHFKNYCSSDLSAIVIAYSAAQNFERRKAIRATIGKQCEVYNCKLVFIGGISSNKSIAERVKEEYAEKRDIFMKNKIDTYVDLNNKAVAMLDWLIEFCPQPKYVIHLIDDAFVNVRIYLQGLSKLGDNERYFYGQSFLRRRPHRNIKSIYYVSPNIYPRPTYPDFIVGISYAFPNSLTRELRCAVHKAKYIWLEDVWLLGEIKEYLGLKLIQSEYTSWHTGFEKLDLNNIRSYLYLHNTGVNDFYRFFNALDLADTVK